MKHRATFDLVFSWRSAGIGQSPGAWASPVVWLIAAATLALALATGCHTSTASESDARMWRGDIASAARAGQSQHAVELYLEWHRRRHRYDNEAMRGLATGVLWHAASDPSPAVRSRVAGIVAEIVASGDVAELTDRIAEHLDDSSDRVAAAAAAALLGHHARATPRAVALLASRDPEARYLALRALHQIGQEPPREAMDALDAALRDPAPAARRAAVLALGRAPSSEDLAHLAALARSDADGSVRALALRGLARASAELALPAGRAALTDPFLGARLAAVALLARWPEATKDDLAALARSSDLYVALRAAVAVRKAGSEPPLTTVQLALASRIWPVRVAALNAVTEIVPPGTALPLARAQLDDGRAEVRLAAARALARAGQPGRAAETLASVLAGPRAEMRLEAAIELLRMNDDRGQQAVAALLHSPSPHIRTGAVAAHRYLDRPTLDLVAAAGDPDAMVRVEAALTLLILIRGEKRLIYRPAPPRAPAPGR